MIGEKGSTRTVGVGEAIDGVDTPGPDWASVAVANAWLVSKICVCEVDFSLEAWFLLIAVHPPKASRTPMTIINANKKPR